MLWQKMSALCSEASSSSTSLDEQVAGLLAWAFSALDAFQAKPEKAWEQISKAKHSKEKAGGKWRQVRDSVYPMRVS